jgi:hypothetical protein
VSAFAFAVSAFVFAVSALVFTAKTFTAKIYCATTGYHRPELRIRIGKQYLFVRQALENSIELLEYPSTFDWDDLIATTWEVVSTTSTCH